MSQFEESSSASMHRQTLLALRPYVCIAHHLPGRIRLRLRPGAAIDQAVRRHAEAGEEALRQLPGVRSIRLNALAGSLLLEYDPERLPFALVDAFVHANGSAQAGDLLDRLLSCHPQ